MHSFLPVFINDECLLSLSKFVYLLVKCNQEYLQREKKKGDRMFGLVNCN